MRRMGADRTAGHLPLHRFVPGSARFHRLLRDRFAADARNQNGAAPPDAARPGKFAGQNGEAKRDNDNGRSWQNDHHQSDQYNAEANGADEKSTQARPRFEPETRDPFLKPTIHKKPPSVMTPRNVNLALSHDEAR